MATNSVEVGINWHDAAAMDWREIRRIGDWTVGGAFMINVYRRQTKRRRRVKLFITDERASAFRRRQIHLATSGRYRPRPVV